MAALFERYQMMLSILTIIEVLFMFSWIRQTFLHNVREQAYEKLLMSMWN